MGWARHLTLYDAELLAQQQDFDLLVTIRSSNSSKKIKKKSKDMGEYKVDHETLPPRLLYRAETKQRRQRIVIVGLGDAAATIGMDSISAHYEVESQRF